MAHDRLRARSVMRPRLVDIGLASPGRQLDPTTASVMGLRLDHDFSRVRVHAEEAAATAARGLGARAYTVGDDIVFGAHQYAPGTPEGERLLAHELAHVVQQTRPSSGGDVEARADAAAAQAVAGDAVHLNELGGADLGVHLQEEIRRSARGSSTATSGANLLRLDLGTLDRFDHNSAVLKPEHAAQLDRIADLVIAMVLRQPGSQSVVTGHADLTGAEDVNLALGRKRALAVAVALVQRGVPLSSIQVESAGDSAPAIKTTKPEPRNRRVEVRFEGPPNTVGGPSGRGASSPAWQPGASPTLPGRPPLGAAPPFARQPWTKPVPISAPKPPWESKAPEVAKPASVGDLAQAVFEIPAVQKQIEAAKGKVLKDLGRTSTREKVVLGTLGVAIGGGALAGIWSNPAARKTALDLLDGKEIPVPYVPGLAIQIFTNQPGGALKVDIIKLVPGLK